MDRPQKIGGRATQFWLGPPTPPNRVSPHLSSCIRISLVAVGDDNLGPADSLVKYKGRVSGLSTVDGHMVDSPVRLDLTIGAILFEWLEYYELLPLVNVQA
jgi:hypothetical protein